MKPQPKKTKWRSKKYLAWVKTLPCGYCGKPADHAHHLIARGNMGGMGTKAGDQFTIPVCAKCHSDIHQGTWTTMVDLQWELICRTLGKAIDDGILK